MSTITRNRRTEHHVRRGDNFYEVETVQQDGEYLATWHCAVCQASRPLRARFCDEAEEQAFASIDAHQLFFHSRRGGESVQPGTDEAKILLKPR
jgi:hypothetical protein